MGSFWSVQCNQLQHRAWLRKLPSLRVFVVMTSRNSGHKMLSCGWKMWICLEVKYLESAVNVRIQSLASLLLWTLWTKYATRIDCRGIETLPATVGCWEKWAKEAGSNRKMEENTYWGVSWLVQLRIIFGESNYVKIRLAGRIARMGEKRIHSALWWGNQS
jgi:hypothetical protein